MTRLLILIVLILMLVALIGVIMSSVIAMLRGGRTQGRGQALEARSDDLQKVGYAALILLMLGVTSGLIGGL